MIYITSLINYFKLNYLKSIRRHKDLLISWNSVWKVKNIYPTDEKKIFNIFLTYIDKLLKNENTIELAFLIFSDIFNEENIKKYIEEIQNLKYKENDENKLKRKELLGIFEEMLNIHQKNNEIKI
ncbi:MAG: hypothetical protein R6V04_05050 [bacterium]